MTGGRESRSSRGEGVRLFAVTLSQPAAAVSQMKEAKGEIEKGRAPFRGDPVELGQKQLRKRRAYSIAERG